MTSAESSENADVAVVVYGDKGSSGRIFLGKAKNTELFRGGNVDEFKVGALLCEDGPLHCIIIICLGQSGQCRNNLQNSFGAAACKSQEETILESERGGFRWFLQCI